MFFCDLCAKDCGYPESICKSRGACEICKSPAVCNDIKLSYLPMCNENASDKINERIFKRFKEIFEKYYDLFSSSAFARVYGEDYLESLRELKSKLEVVSDYEAC